MEEEMYYGLEYREKSDLKLTEEVLKKLNIDEEDLKEYGPLEDFLNAKPVTFVTKMGTEATAEFELQELEGGLYDIGIYIRTTYNGGIYALHFYDEQTILDGPKLRKSNINNAINSVCECIVYEISSQINECYDHSYWDYDSKKLTELFSKEDVKYNAMLLRIFTNRKKLQCDNMSGYVNLLEYL